MLANGLSDSFSQLFTKCYSDCIIFNNLCRRLININGEWSNFLPMEYGSNSSKHYSETDFNYHLFSYWNKLKRLLKSC